MKFPETVFPVLKSVLQRKSFSLKKFLPLNEQFYMIGINLNFFHIYKATTVNLSTFTENNPSSEHPDSYTILFHH